MLLFKWPGDNHQIDYSNLLTYHSRSGGDTHEAISPLYDVLSLFKVEKQRFMSSYRMKKKKEKKKKKSMRESW
jgi:hypothetical protein